MGTLVPAGRYANLHASEGGTAPSTTVRLQAARVEGWGEYARGILRGDKLLRDVVPAKAGIHAVGYP